MAERTWEDQHLGDLSGVHFAAERLLHVAY